MTTGITYANILMSYYNFFISCPSNQLEHVQIWPGFHTISYFSNKKPAKYELGKTIIRRNKKSENRKLSIKFGLGRVNF